MPAWTRCALTLAAACLLASASSPGEATPAESDVEASQDEDMSSLLQVQLGLSTSTADARRAAAAQKASSRLPPAAERGAASGTRAVAGNASSVLLALATNSTKAIARNASSEPAPTAAAPKAAALNATAPRAAATNATAWAPLAETFVEHDELLEGIESMPFLHLVNATYGLHASQQEIKLSPFKDPGGWLMFFIGLFLPVAAYASYVLIGYCCARSLGKAIELGIETYDTSALGVDVEIGKLLINPFEGLLTIDGLTVDNPKGYKSDYLLQAKSVQVDFDMKALILSGFSHVVIEKVALKRVDIIYEKTWSSSNVHDILAFLEGDPNQPQHQCLPQNQCLPTMEKKDEKKEEEAARRKKAEKEKKEKEEKKKKDHLNVELHEVLVEDVGMRLQGQMIGGHGARLALADIKFADFSKEANSGFVDDIVKFLLKSVMKTVVANVVGRRTAEWCM